MVVDEQRSVTLGLEEPPMLARMWQTESTKPEESASDHRETCRADIPYTDDWNPQIPLANCSRLSRTKCHGGKHSSHRASVQAMSERG
jgi:hypothetical protein